MDELREYLPIIAPIAAIQLILMVVALVDLARREQAATRGPKLMWVLIIVAGSLLGSVAYFIVGRRNDA